MKEKINLKPEVFSKLVDELTIRRNWKELSYTKIDEADLEEVYDSILDKCGYKCYTSLNQKRVLELHKMFMKLRNTKTVDYVDPAAKVTKLGEESVDLQVDNELSAWQLMNEPRHWKMTSKENAKEFFYILNVFTNYAPFEGRPFVRAWLKALLPCLCRWIILSVDTEKKKRCKKSHDVLISTLKHFLGAFGQPGIVVCWEDRGAQMLKTLQNSARSVEALGRGEVESYYWKRITESTLGGMKKWAELANVLDEPLKISQLDLLPAGWLRDASDWAHVFSRVVSEEINPIFEKLLQDTLSGKHNANVHAGPPKTLSRSIAKSEEYMQEFHDSKNEERWINFGKKFEKTFKRTPSNPIDFVWNIVDFARCSVEVPTAIDVLQVKQIVEDRFEVVCVKNGYNSNVKAKGSGYRDMKLLVKVDFDDLKLKNIPNVEHKTVFICEIQIICKAWLDNKKTTSLSYKILRAVTMRDLCKDFAKYIFRDEKTKEHEPLDPARNWKTTSSASYWTDSVSKTLKSVFGPEIDILDVFKNRWLNLFKLYDLTDLPYSSWQEVFKHAVDNGWGGVTITILENDFNVGFKEINWATYWDSSDEGDKVDTYEHNAADTKWDGMPALHYAACKGNASIVKGLIAAGFMVNKTMAEGYTALHQACSNRQESCVRALLAANCDINARANVGTALDLVDKLLRSHYDQSYQRIARILRGENVPVLNPENSRKEGVDINHLTRAATRGSLTDLLDKNSVSTAVLNLFLEQNMSGDTSLDFLQALWYDANIIIQDQNTNRRTLLQKALSGRRYDIILKLIDVRANIETKDNWGWTPLFYALNWGHGNLIDGLIDRGANATALSKKGRTPLHVFNPDDFCSSDGNIVSKLIESDADVNAKDIKGWTPLHCAIGRYSDHRKWDMCEGIFMVRALIEHGANVNVVSSTGWSPLLLAACKSDLRVVTELIEARADVCQKTHSGVTAIDLTKGRYLHPHYRLQFADYCSMVNKLKAEMSAQNWGNE